MNEELCKQHAEALKRLNKKIDQQYETIKSIDSALCGGLDRNGKYREGFIVQIKWIKKVQALIIFLLAGLIIAMFGIKYGFEVKKAEATEIVKEK